MSDRLDERTPYGFTWREAIDALQQVSAMTALSAWAKGTHREPSEWQRCRAPRCEQAGSRTRARRSRRGDLRLCDRHAALLDRARGRADAALLRAQVEEGRRHALAYLDARMDAAERKAIREHLAPLRAERKARRGPRYTGPARRGHVYRLRDDQDRLLYVGKTYSPKARLLGATGHAATKPWWPEVAVVEVATYRTEEAALEAERHAIAKEDPLYNLDRPTPHRPRKPRPLAVVRGDIS